MLIETVKYENDQNDSLLFILLFFICNKFLSLPLVFHWQHFVYLRLTISGTFNVLLTGINGSSTYDKNSQEKERGECYLLTSLFFYGVVYLP
jgi:hypothetical protein